jgi:peptidase MA superfamily protein
MGKTLRRAPQGDRGRWRAAAARAAVATFLAGLIAAAAGAQPAVEHAHRFDAGRFTVVAYPHDTLLARSLLRVATANDTFPGLPRPAEQVLLEIAPDGRRFREWVGPGAPEWGAAIAFPEQSRIVMQGSRAGSGAGDPVQVVRHELAHLALHERLGDLPARWFDEGYASYAAGEWGRDEVLSANLSLAIRGAPTFAGLDSAFEGGADRASAAYALAYRAVAELASLDPNRGLALFFKYWRETSSFDVALRQAYIGYNAALFEERWRARTRRRYGVLAAVTDISVAGAFLTVLLTPLYLARRRRERERLAQLKRAEEEADRRERDSAIEALLRSIGPGQPNDDSVS